MAFPSITARRPRITLAATLLLLAWMPSLLFFGHWSEFASPSAHQSMTVASHHEGGQTAEDAPHALHCHGSSSCADQGGGASAFDLGASSALVPVARPLEVGTRRTSITLIEGLSAASPDAPPPRTVA